MVCKAVPNKDNKDFVVVFHPKNRPFLMTGPFGERLVHVGACNGNL